MLGQSIRTVAPVDEEERDDERGEQQGRQDELVVSRVSTCRRALVQLTFLRADSSPSPCDAGEPGEASGEETGVLASSRNGSGFRFRCFGGVGGGERAGCGESSIGQDGSIEEQ